MHVFFSFRCLTCNYIRYTQLHTFHCYLYSFALLVHWHHIFTQQTCSIHMRNFVLTRPHGWWAVQRVYALPFPKRLFLGKCNRQDCVCSTTGIWSLPVPSLWQGRCLLLFTIVVWSDVMASVSIKMRRRPSIQSGAVLCAWSRGGWQEDEGWDLQAVRARAQTPPLRAPHHSQIGQGAHGPCRNTGTISLWVGMRGHEQAYYPGEKCDSAADTVDGSILWYINTWAMKWSQQERSWITKPAL